MLFFEQLGTYFQMLVYHISNPAHIAILFRLRDSGYNLWRSSRPDLHPGRRPPDRHYLRHGHRFCHACLLAIYVGGTYGGSYSSILINIPGTAASAATALDGYPWLSKAKQAVRSALALRPQPSGPSQHALSCDSLPDRFAFRPAVHLL
jgi:putative tricarboxylic transport membrane protein